MEIDRISNQTLKRQLPKKEETNESTTYLKKLDQEANRLLVAIKDKANKKTIGRKVRDAEIIKASLKLIGPDQIKDLQALTYSEKDRLALAHEDYQKKNGKLSLEGFIAKLLSGEIHNKKD
ncbi:MAG: hypothetical protein H7336_15405 [Bacteriovorax sp.]|nr:hypothetical protein [Bacteriovorax sp.]